VNKNGVRTRHQGCALRQRRDLGITHLWIGSSDLPSVPRTLRSQDEEDGVSTESWKVQAGGRINLDLPLVDVEDLLAGFLAGTQCRMAAFRIPIFK
jgi:hypothetical protein